MYSPFRSLVFSMRLIAFAAPIQQRNRRTLQFQTKQYRLVSVIPWSRWSPWLLKCHQTCVDGKIGAQHPRDTLVKSVFVRLLICIVHLTIELEFVLVNHLVWLRAGKTTTKIFCLLEIACGIVSDIKVATLAHKRRATTFKYFNSFASQNISPVNLIFCISFRSLPILETSPCYQVHRPWRW